MPACAASGRPAGPRGRSPVLVIPGTRPITVSPTLFRRIPTVGLPDVRSVILVPAAHVLDRPFWPSLLYHRIGLACWGQGGLTPVRTVPKAFMG